MARSEWGAGGRVAGDAHAARRRGRISAHARMFSRAQVVSAAPSRPRRVRTLRSLGGHAGCAAHARTGCRCAERCSAACVRVRVRLRALPGDLITAEVRWQVLSRAVPQLADKRRGRRWRVGVLFRTSTAVITGAIRSHQRRHPRALVVRLTFPPQASVSSRTNWCTVAERVACTFLRSCAPVIQRFTDSCERNRTGGSADGARNEEKVASRCGCRWSL